MIFNPGTENPALSQKLTKQGVEALNACTLVMLSTNQYLESLLQDFLTYHQNQFSTDTY